MELIAMALVIALILFGSLLFFPRLSKKGATTSSNTKLSTEGVKTYTKGEVSMHNTRDDCWIIVKGKVYDVTPYVFEHPGGDAILNNAGGDSTEGFYGPQHATRVFDMVDEFYIGDLKS
ncbi:cytochrome B5-like protein isoform X2 [Asparagus officinalis]|uniref:cytochrome B5-like protein isoform X2 n=1 Tax=Asparagus officinalis TaxID=4686 RepID=UPI00098DF2FC|nr:cytochrome B5-like protein isoform X2 [Asparagus officinalis]